MPNMTRKGSKSRKALEDLTEEEMLEELGKESISEAFGAVVDEKTIERRLLVEKKIHQKHIKSKKTLRNKLPSQPAIDVANGDESARSTRWILPEEPATIRAEYVENTLRPSMLKFFQRVKCDCEECMASGDRRWDTINGMKCLISLKGEAPTKRPMRRARKKDKDFVSPLMRRLTTKIMNDVPNHCSDNESFNERKRLLGSPDWTAEVVVIMSSLRSSRGPFNDSVCAMHLLDCKGVEYFAIDVNTDVGPDLPDKALIARWRHLHWVFRDPIKSTINKTKRDVIVPQIMIDGVPIGGVQELQMLEEENDLDYMLAREVCPNCLRNRMVSCGRPPKLNPDGSRVVRVEEQFPVDPTTGQTNYPKDYCYNCGAVFREMINSEVLPPEHLEILLKRSFKNANHHEVPSFQRTKDFLSKLLPMQMIEEDISLPGALQKGYREQRMIDM